MTLSFDPLPVTQAPGIRFPTYCSISKLQRVKGDWCRKSSQNFALFDPPPVKFSGGWAKSLSELIKFNLGSNL